jgi:putative two-component system response regulator
VLERVEALIASPDSAPEDVARALAELGAVLDPEVTAPSPKTALIFARALDLVASLRFEPEGPALAECLRSIAKYAFLSGHALKGLAPAQRAVESFRRLGSESRPSLRKALTIRGALLADTGNLPVAIEVYAEALEVAIELRDPFAEAAVCNNLGCALIYAAQYQDAIACLERVEALTAGNEGLESVRGMAQTNIALACLHLEDYGRGLRAAKAAVELQDNPATASARLSRVLAETHYTRLLLEVDAPAAAKERCMIAKRVAHESGLERAELYAGMAEGLCEVHSGTIDVGLSRLSKVLERARVLKGSLRDVLIAMVKANELAGRTDVALVYLRELMMHTKEIQQENALLHHRLHLEQLERKQQPASSPDALLAQREVKLRDQLVQQVAHQELMKSRIEMLERLAVTAELRDDTTGEHSYRVGKLSALVAQEYGCDENTVFMVDLAARLHDIGKIGIPDGILLKNGRLNEAEMKLMQTHALIGSEILAQSNVPHMKMAEEIARFHHEHWNGGGYPFGIGQTAIPLAARITALADVFDALTHRRPYKEAWSVDRALATIAGLKGSQFDPELTDLFLALVPRLRREVGDLDQYLGQAARESRFIQARRKIAETLKQYSTNGSATPRS